MTILRPLMLGCLLTISGCYAGATELTIGAAPRSLAGTHVDGELRAGADGEFVFDERARLAFDYYLTADGELDASELDAWVRGELSRRLPADAAEQAFVAWTAYLEFRGQAAETLSRPQEDLAAAERTLLAALDEQLGEYAIAGEERGQISRAFALRRISGLTGEARERALAELGAEAPGEAGAFIAARREIAAAELVGDDVQSLRREHFGDAAAQRLAALDARRAEWARRVAALQSEREALRARLSGAELEVAIAALEGRLFAPEELRRVRALDRLNP